MRGFLFQPVWLFLRLCIKFVFRDADYMVLWNSDWGEPMWRNSTIAFLLRKSVQKLVTHSFASCPNFQDPVLIGCMRMAEEMLAGNFWLRAVYFALPWMPQFIFCAMKALCRHGEHIGTGYLLSFIDILCILTYILYIHTYIQCILDFPAPD